MSKSPRKFHPTFKFKIVLDSFSSGSVSEIARRYSIGANQLSMWRKQLLDKGHLVFQSERVEKERYLEKKIGQLENLIGKKEIELNLLKKYLDFYVPPDGA